MPTLTQGPFNWQRPWSERSLHYNFSSNSIFPRHKSARLHVFYVRVACRGESSYEMASRGRTAHCMQCAHRDKVWRGLGGRRPLVGAKYSAECVLMVSDDFILHLVEETLYEYGYADVAKALRLKRDNPTNPGGTTYPPICNERQDGGTPQLAKDTLCLMPKKLSISFLNNANDHSSREADPGAGPAGALFDGSSDLRCSPRRSITESCMGQPHHAAPCVPEPKTSAASWLRSSILSRDGLAEASLAAGWNNGCWNPSLVDTRVSCAFSGDDHLLLAALYLIRRASFFIEIASTGDTPHTQDSIRLDISRSSHTVTHELLPLLDFLNKNKCTLDKYLPHQVLDGLNRNAESQVFTQVLSPNCLSRSFLSSPSLHFGFLDIQSRSLQDFVFTMNRFLLDTLLRKAIASTGSPLPPGFLKTIVHDSLKYRALKNPYLLPPRSKALRRKPSNETAFFAKTQVDEARLLGPILFEPRKLYSRDLHTSEVWFCRYSHLGKWLATGSLDGRVIVYDAHHHYLIVRTCRITPEQEEKAFVAINDAERPVLANKAVICCCWDPSDRYLVTCGLDTIVRVWDLGDMSAISVSQDSVRVTRSMGPAPIPDLVERPQDAVLVACFCLGQDLKVWACEFLPNPDPACVPQFVIGSPDKVLKIFDVFGNEVFDFYGNLDSGVDDAEVAQEMSAAAARAGQDGSTLIDESLMDLEEVDAELIVARIIDARSRSKQQPQKLTPFSRVNDLAITPDGKLLIIATNDCEVIMYKIPDPELLRDAATNTLVVSRVRVGKKITSCSVSANGNLLLLSCAPDELQVWDISNVDSTPTSCAPSTPFLHRRLLGFQQLTYIVRSCFGYLDPHTGLEQLVLSGSKDGYVCVWDLESGQLLSRSAEHEGLCNAVAWNVHGDAGPAHDFGASWCSVGDDGNVVIYAIKLLAKIKGKYMDEPVL